MAWDEIIDGRTRTKFAGGASGVRTYVGDIVDLIANEPSVGTADHPYDARLKVTATTIQSETKRDTTGIPYGRMTVNYDYGSVGSWQTSKAYAGFREDEFTVGESSQTIVADLTRTDAFPNGQPIKYYELIGDKWDEKSGTLNIKGGSAVWNIHVILEEVPILNWMFAADKINSDTFAGVSAGYLLFDGFSAATIPPSSTVTGDPLNDVRIQIAVNRLGWNKNQFGEIAGGDLLKSPDARGNTKTVPHDYIAYETVSFSALFHML